MLKISASYGRWGTRESGRENGKVIETNFKSSFPRIFRCFMPWKRGMQWDVFIAPLFSWRYLFSRKTSFCNKLLMTNLCYENLRNSNIKEELQNKFEKSCFSTISQQRKWLVKFWQCNVWSKHEQIWFQMARISLIMQIKRIWRRTMKSINNYAFTWVRA